MKAFALVTRENNYIAKDLLCSIKNLNIIFSLTDEKDIAFSFKTKDTLDNVDIIFVFIDKLASKNSAFQKELDSILSSNKVKKEKSIVPIIIDGAEIPERLKRIPYVSYESNSKDSEEIPRQKIEELIRIFKNRKSIRYRKTQQYRSLVLLILMPILMLMITIICLLLPGGGSMSSYELPIIMASITFTITISTITIIFIYIFKRKIYEDKKEEVDTFSSKLDSAIVSEKPKALSNAEEDEDQEVEEKSEIDPLGLMKFNLVKIKEFYSWSQSQAKGSFILAVCMSILGFLLVVAGVILPIVLKLSIQIAFIPAIGGVITELIAGTALVVYRTSISQVNYYHNALHENERFLTSVTLLNKFSTTKDQDEMLKEIIRSEIQMNMNNVDKREESEKNKNLN